MTNQQEEAEANPTEVVSPDKAPTAPIISEREDDIVEGAITPFEGDMMQVTIEVASHLSDYEKAMDTIINFIIRRTYAHDWVSHDKSGTPIEERTANITSAAAERIARDLGIMESNRVTPKKVWHGEKHPGHYYYETEADFTFRGRTIHAIGRASSTNKLHSHLAPHQIPEHYILQEAIRDCTKQGVKGLFGLRKIPITKLAELGYDVSKVKYVNFQSGEKSQARTNAQATEKPRETQAPIADAEQMTIQVESMAAKTSKGGKPFFSVEDIEGVHYYAWGGPTTELVLKLMDALKSKKPIAVMVKGGQYPTIISVVES